MHWTALLILVPFWCLCQSLQVGSYFFIIGLLHYWIIALFFHLGAEGENSNNTLKGVTVSNARIQIQQTEERSH